MTVGMSFHEIGGKVRVVEQNLDWLESRAVIENDLKPGPRLAVGIILARHEASADQPSASVDRSDQ